MDNYTKSPIPDLNFSNSLWLQSLCCFLRKSSHKRTLGFESEGGRIKIKLGFFLLPS